MDYFKILNLNKEPFSNSPEPEFFFQSAKHVGCLQKLELAVRLRRGLSVVVGEVGTGKTTLCRQLILKFAASEEDRNQIETHLIMDPSFTNPLEFLSTVAMTFGVANSGGTSEWQLKENIKNYLFGKGVDEGKIVVLILDEGQKLPDFCLELLREFLNYETNEFKLLQIVIFAQKEFEQILKKQKNFADRVNFYYLLRPLNFLETQGMVKFRIAKASDTDKAPSLFSYPGLWALYLATGGYPRKIVTLCHQIVLALIIQNRSKAGWFLVRSCSRRVPDDKKKIFRWVTATVVAAIIVIATMTGFYPGLLFNIWPARETSGRIKTQAISSSGYFSFGHRGQTAPAPVVEAQALTRDDDTQSSNKTMPDLLGKVELKSGRTIWRLLNDFYGDFDREQLRKVANANPHIKNLSRVSAGEIIELPAIPANSNPLASGKCWVRVARSEKIDEIYELYKNYHSTLPSLTFLPYWNSREGLAFTIVLKDGFSSMEDALGAARRLPEPLAGNAEVFVKVSDDTIFFKR